ncbi:hypothetical protein ATCC90586_003942 [Pythium insidiosum]|nr:hypothetical protein ATCC90586_003942 [Pythium insidiosum]
MESQAEFDPMDELQDLEEQQERRALAGRDHARQQAGTANPDLWKPNDDGDVDMEDSHPDEQSAHPANDNLEMLDEEAKEESGVSDDDDEDNDNTVCTVCKTSEDEGNILMCDICDAGAIF